MMVDEMINEAARVVQTMVLARSPSLRLAVRTRFAREEMRAEAATDITRQWRGYLGRSLLDRKLTEMMENEAASAIQFATRLKLHRRERHRAARGSTRPGT
jgi:hypothetical protein